MYTLDYSKDDFQLKSQRGPNIKILSKNLLSSIIRYRPKKGRHDVKNGAKKSYFASLLIWQCQTSKPALRVLWNVGPQCAMGTHSEDSMN